jgi:hypothetical protein
MFPVNGSLHMAPLFPRSGPGESGSPGTIEVLRLPVRPVRSLICFASGVHALLRASCLVACAPGRSEGPSRPGSLFDRRPEHAALAPAVYASRTVLPPSLQDSLPADWLAFAGRASLHPSSFSGLCLAQRKFHHAPLPSAGPVVRIVRTIDLSNSFMV